MYIIPKLTNIIIDIIIVKNIIINNLCFFFSGFCLIINVRQIKVNIESKVDKKKNEATERFQKRENSKIILNKKQKEQHAHRTIRPCKRSAPKRLAIMAKKEPIDGCLDLLRERQ